jgi:hypothetical protein
MTLKEKYAKLKHKKAITDKIAFKLTGVSSGVYLRRTITDDKINSDYEDYINEVFDKQLKFQEVEKKHYDNLI